MFDIFNEWVTGYCLTVLKEYLDHGFIPASLLFNRNTSCCFSGNLVAHCSKCAQLQHNCFKLHICSDQKFGNTEIYSYNESFQFRQNTTFKCSGVALFKMKLYQQHRYPLHDICFALTDGEVVERLWAYLRKYAKATKEMRPSHCIDVLTGALLHYSKKSAQKLGNILLTLSTCAKGLQYTLSVVCHDLILRITDN